MLSGAKIPALSPAGELRPKGAASFFGWAGKSLRVRTVKRSQPSIQPDSILGTET